MSVFPEAIIGTERLRLRPLGAQDIDATVAACNDSESLRWLPLPQPYTRTEGEEFCCRTARELRERGDGIQLAMTLPETDALVGAIGLKRTDWRGLVTEIGYWTCPEHRGRGYTTEAVRSLSVWALEMVERVELRAAPGNLASRRVAEKAGFTYEGVLRNAGFTHGGRVDLCSYSLIRADLTGP